MTMWECKPCKVSIPVEKMEKIRAHLRTKKHAYLRNACPHCSSLRLRRIPGETWDRDGIREAKKCARCLTEYKSYAHGWTEKDADEYTGKLPERIQQKLDAAFHRAAVSRGYVLKVP